MVVEIYKIIRLFACFEMRLLVCFKIDKFYFYIYKIVAIFSAINLLFLLNSCIPVNPMIAILSTFV